MLLKNGAPFHVAFDIDRSDVDSFRMDHVERRAMCIVMGQLEGGKFNWNSMEFEDAA
ncbi:hypothetical protein [Paraburkholderia atlantica]|uniref:hypothetical protein n=1 Tax=Paraburkholderia atlantica TaxID=2654982 RepID=UPI001608C945|nr:hypothetical protein [Paraburkholderia atlantica]MBB5508158.1 hypothetical protein [Paraburkholderia atlantica]